MAKLILMQARSCLLIPKLDIYIDFGAGKEALLVYQDDSSDEMEDVMNDLLVPASDTDDDFDEEDGDEAMEVNLN